ncbi:MAG: hypothetical protein L0G54_14660 [Brevibacterium sp.]|nr:hypothetical protein [Brevibacterium sp.]
MSLDDDRRDIAVLGDLDAKRLNRLAKRNRGADPFEVSGDAITRHENGGHDSDQEPVTTTSQNTFRRMK